VSDLSFSVPEEIERLTVRAEAAELAYEKAEESGRALRKGLQGEVDWAEQFAGKAARETNDQRTRQPLSERAHHCDGQAHIAREIADRLSALLDSGGEK
jgi:hypothetical protein